MGRRITKARRMLGQWLPPALLRSVGRPAALFFHGVEPRTDDAKIQINHHEAGAFREIAASLKQDFDLLPLSQLRLVLAKPRRYRRALFLMSDDGYANTLGVAADILGDLQLPWTLFVSTHHIDTGEPNPVFLARLFIYCAPTGRYGLPHFNQPIELNGPSDRHASVARFVNRLVALDAAAAAEVVAAMRAVLSNADLDALLRRFSSERFLSWPQIRKLNRRGVEIGAHAHHHWAMHDRQSPDYLRNEAALSRKRIEAEVGPCRFFSYPFGNVDDVGRKAWRAVRDAGFEYAFTTLSGSLDASRNPFLLPRYGLGSTERNIASVVPLLRLGNARLAHWQRRIA